jgi:outer membrane receptor for ferrienterochelin and colicin
MKKVICAFTVCMSIAFTPSSAQKMSADSTLYELPLEELMNFKVFIASKKEENVNVAPATVYVITQADIQNNGYYTLKDALSNIPGITAINLDFFVFGGQRGFVSNFSQTLLMINGREVENLIAAETFICNQFATHNIKQIEVMQGPGSSLYGANALVGVINIITKQDSKDYEKMEIQVDKGSQGTNSFSMIFGKNYDKVRLSGSARVFRSSNWDYQDFIRDTVKFSEGHPTAVQQTAFTMPYNNRHFSVPLSGKLTVNNFYIGTEGYYLETHKGLENVSLDYSSQRDHRLFHMTYAGWDKQFNGKTKAVIEYQFSNERIWGRNFVFSQSKFDQMVADGRDPHLPFTEAEISANFLDVYSQEQSKGSKRHRIDAKLNTVLLNDLDLTVGYLFDYLDVLGLSLSNTTLSPYFNDNRTGDDQGAYLITTKNGLYAQAKKPFFNNKLFVTLGSRLDYHNKYKDVFSFRSGVVYQPGKKTFIKALFGQAFREPNIFEYGAFLGTELNFNLNPAQINSYELSVTHQVGSNFKVMVTAYKNDITSLIVPLGTLAFTNSNDVEKVIGLEGQMMFKFHKFSGDVNYTYTNPEDKVMGAQTVDALNNYKHRVNLGLNYDISKFIRVNARLNHYSAITAVHGNPVFAFKQVANPDYDATDPSSPETILNPNAKLNEIDAWTNVNFTISTRNLNFQGLDVTFQGTVMNAFDGEFYQPNVRMGGPRQFLQPGRQFIARLVFNL